MAPGESLRERFCHDRRCAPERFAEELFRCCVPRRMRLWARLLGGVKVGLFRPDRELIVRAGGATTIPELRDAIDDYWASPENHWWWRRLGRLRMSTSRLRRIAGEYLPLTPPGHVRSAAKSAR